MNRPWTASHGFGCALAIILLTFGWNEGLRFAFNNSEVFATWVKRNSFFAEFSFNTLRGCMWVVVSYIFAGIRPLSSTVRDFGFNTRFTVLGFLLGFGAFSLGLLNLFFVQRGIAQQNTDAITFYYGGRDAWLLFAVQSAWVSPFYEEVIMRGFLYRAFRGSFRVIPSTLLVLAVQIYFHWGLVSKDFIALIFLSIGSVIVSSIRERSQNTWNCVFFHAIYNATVLRQWQLSLIDMIIFALLCSRRKFLPEAAAVSSPQNFHS